MKPDLLRSLEGWFVSHKFLDPDGNSAAQSGSVSSRLADLSMALTTAWSCASIRSYRAFIPSRF